MFNNNPFNIHRAKTEVLEEVNESFKYHIPEDIPANERTAFHGAAADAAKKGKKSFNFGGKTHPVTMKKDLANKIADQKESVNESFDYHNDMAKAHASHSMRHNSEFHHGNHNDDAEDMHSRAIDIHKHAHAAHIHARNLSSYDPKGEYKKAAKDAHKYSETAIGTTKDAVTYGKFKTGKPKHSFPKLVSPTKLAKAHNESTMSFREKLMSLYEGDRAAHYKGATAPEGMHDKFKTSKGAMDMVNVQKSVEADGMKAAKDTADNIKKSIPGRKMRSNDKKDGDNTIIPAATPVKDPAAKMQTAESYGASGNAIPNSLLDAIGQVTEKRQIRTNRVRGDRTMHDDHVKKGMGMGGEQTYSTVNKLDQRHYAKYISKKSGHDSYFDGNDLVHKKSSKTVVPNALISKTHSPNQLADKMKAHGDKHKG